MILSLPLSAPVSVIQIRASLGSACFFDASNEPSATQTFFQGLEQQTLEKKNVQRKHSTSMAPVLCIVGGGGVSECSLFSYWITCKRSVHCTCRHLVRSGSGAAALKAPP